jgi:hypothetical protein
MIETRNESSAGSHTALKHRIGQQIGDIEVVDLAALDGNPGGERNMAKSDGQFRHRLWFSPNWIDTATPPRPALCVPRATLHPPAAGV